MTQTHCLLGGVSKEKTEQRQSRIIVKIRKVHMVVSMELCGSTAIFAWEMGAEMLKSSNRSDQRD